MSIVHVSIDGTSIQTANYVISQIDDESSPSVALDIQDVALRDGARIVSKKFQPKQITITGRIKGSSQAVLEQNIDLFKQIVNVYLGRMDIEYAGGVRRFIVSTQSTAFQRGAKQLTFCPFSLTFVVADPPFGLKANSLGGNMAVEQTLSLTARTAMAIESTVTFDGSAHPVPRTTFILDNASNIDSISERIVGQKSIITAGTAFSSGDELVFDTERQQVLLNGFPINFDGIFPEYQAGINKLMTIVGQRGYNQLVDFQQQILDEFITIRNSEMRIGQGILSFSGAGKHMRRCEIYMKRPVTTTTGTVRLRISDDGNGSTFAGGGEFRSQSPSENYIAACTVSIDVTDIPLEGGWVSFNFSSDVTKNSLSDPLRIFMNLQLDCSNLNGEIYVGISRADQYSYATHAQYLNYKFSLNSGKTWQYDPNKDLVFRILAPAENSGGTLINEWSIDKKISSNPRYL